MCTNTLYEPITRGERTSRTICTNEASFIAARRHFTQKSQCIAPWHPPQHKSHATIAATTFRFATKDSKTQCGCNVQKPPKRIEAATTVPSSPLLQVTALPSHDTMLRTPPSSPTHVHKSPLPKVTTFQSHHFSKAPLSTLPATRKIASQLALNRYENRPTPLWRAKACLLGCKQPH